MGDSRQGDAYFSIVSKYPTRQHFPYTTSTDLPLKSLQKICRLLGYSYNKELSIHHLLDAIYNDERYLKYSVAARVRKKEKMEVSNCKSESDESSADFPDDNFSSDDGS